jgi:triacylglycerol lipase
MQRWLERRGWDVFVITLTPSDGTVSLRELAEQIERILPPGCKIDIVSYSMGGLVCREYIRTLAGAARIDRLITISTPHHGTWLAYFSGRPACQEMRPASAFLNSLNGTLDLLERVQFISIWTPLDLMILPASSSRMSIGRECKQWVMAHPLMILQRRCLREIEQLLAPH